MTEPNQKSEPQPVSRFKHAVTGGALWFSALALAAGTTVCRAETTLESAFQSPPTEARPATWWHWIGGGIAPAGIANDIAAMKAVGLSEVYLFNIGWGKANTPDYAEFLSEPWLQRFDRTLQECEKHGLGFGVHNCDGWSESGGPWIKPVQSMKVFTWSATDVEGGKPIQVQLPKPKHHLFYKDTAVVAFKLPDGGRVNGPGAAMKLSGDKDANELAKLVDGDPQTSASARVVVFEFAQPQTVRSVVLRGAQWQRPFEQRKPVTVEASADGNDYRTIGEGTSAWESLELLPSYGDVTIAVAETTARYFRVNLSEDAGEIELSGALKVHFAEGKALRAYVNRHGGESHHYKAYPGPPVARPVPAAGVIATDEIVNLTAQMQADGALEWSPPPGRWRILRFGFTSTGKMNNPASEAGKGLECDKLNPQTVRFHLDQYVGKLLTRAGDKAGRVFRVMETDSWECGIQNWTGGLEQRFQQRVGYDLLMWLPALAEGWVVGDPDRTERALWDWRRFLADQLAESYFSEVHRWANEKGLRYISEPTGRQQFLYDIAYQRHNDWPMGEFWLPTDLRDDNKVAASLAHLTGRKVVTAEAYTSGVDFSVTPARLKRLGDQAFCAGVTHYTFHTFAHQQYDVFGPGYVFGSFGLHFNRHNTWFAYAKPWIDYLARCGALLQQGQFVADILAYVGEDAPNYIGPRDSFQPTIPPGYDYDGADVQAIFDAQVKNGRIVMPSGMSYRLLLLPDRIPHMRLAVMEKIHQLVQDGAVIVGAKPQRSPSLQDLGAGDARLRELADELWGEAPSGKVDRQVGKGRVFDGMTFEEIFAALKLPADFAYQGKARLLYLHRQTTDAEIYFVCNQEDKPVRVEASFRVGAKQPELWNPVTGARRVVGGARCDGDRVTFPLELEEVGSVFVVFRRPLDPSLPAEKETVVATQELTGPWEVTFADVPLSPGRVMFEKLQSWTEHPDEKVQYFSGAADYRMTFTAPAGRGELWLDLGKVQDIAVVTINGREVGTLWKTPYRLCVDEFVRPGANELVVRVVNTWQNRLVWDLKRGKKPAGAKDAMPNPEGVAFVTSNKKLRAESPLLPSGLLGPVSVQLLQRK